MAAPTAAAVVSRNRVRLMLVLACILLLHRCGTGPVQFTGAQNGSSQFDRAGRRRREAYSQQQRKSALFSDEVFTLSEPHSLVFRHSRTTLSYECDLALAHARTEPRHQYPVREALSILTRVSSLV